MEWYSSNKSKKLNKTLFLYMMTTVFVCCCTVNYTNFYFQIYIIVIKSKVLYIVCVYVRVCIGSTYYLFMSRKQPNSFSGEGGGYQRIPQEQAYYSHATIRAIASLGRKIPIKNFSIMKLPDFLPAPVQSRSAL